MAKKRQRTPTIETSPSREDSHSHEDRESEESGPDTNKEGDEPLYQIDLNQENIQKEYGCPFSIYLADESMHFRNLDESFITQPRKIDWQLLEKIGTGNNVKEYLANVNRLQYAEMQYQAYHPLTLEFISTMNIEDKNKLLTCQMMGRECKVTPKVMKDVFGFTSVGTKKKPIGYLKRAPMDWKVISGSDKFTSNGASFFLVKDVALGFFGKFITYQVSGKDQTTRLNQHELL
ncbi:gibberellin 2-oxidase 7 [Striga asiatica]|uniref:Gibberellin 2-oxidase 7 n=1 Tax=Striga asiatica TaxID=4170 RepID=A0A5A7PU13_STRAF|nr:gibberellin 2-oxidase 7 [Striga asiatica]